jgi:hypothetical protein
MSEEKILSSLPLPIFPLTLRSHDFFDAVREIEDFRTFAK